MRVLVTGGAGYIGSHIVAELVRREHKATVVDDLSRGDRAAICKSAQQKLMPLYQMDPEVVLSCDAVIHAAAYAYVAESMEVPERYYYNNVINTLRLLWSMDLARVRRLVFCSTNQVTEPGNPYAQSKRMAENAIKEKAAYAGGGLWYTIFRYHNVAGANPATGLGECHVPEPHLIPRSLECIRDRKSIEVEGDDYATPDGTCLRDYVHVCDVARVTVDALEDKETVGRTIEVGSGVGTSVQEIVEMCRRVTGKPLIAQVGPRRTGNPAVCVAANRHPGITQNTAHMIASQWEWMQKHPNGYGK